MSFFKPKEREVAIETQEDLPKFHFDVNGFLMFDDPSLGGCGIYEVVPTIMTGAVTHRETFGSNAVDTKAKGYTPSRAMEVVGDRRRDAVMQWVSFVNGLLPDDDAESQTHVQVILKKTHPSEWWDAYGHAIDNLHGHVGAPAPSLGRHGRAYRLSYEEMLDDLGKADMSDSGMPWNGAAYDVLGYIVVSYTPSSEGWWLDGRDDDYYIRDSHDERTLFGVDGMAERIGRSIERRRERQTERDESNVADALFPIDEERIAQVLQTRMRKIERKMSAYSQRVGNDALAFTIRRTHMVDNSMLMSFWNDPLTSYRYKVWNMHTDMADVITGMRNEEAAASGDVSLLSGHDATDGEMSSFLDRFVGKEASEVVDDGDDENDDGAVAYSEMPEDVSDAWGEISPELASGKRETLTDEDRFIDRYRRLAISNVTAAPASDGNGGGHDAIAFGHDDRLAGNVTYDQTSRTDNVKAAISQLDMERRKRCSEQEDDKMRELGVDERKVPGVPDRTRLDAIGDAPRRRTGRGEGDVPEIPASIGTKEGGGRTRQNGGNPFEKAAERRAAFNRQMARAHDGSSTQGNASGAMPASDGDGRLHMHGDLRPEGTQPQHKGGLKRTHRKISVSYPEA